MSRLWERLCMFRYAGEAPTGADTPAEEGVGWQLFTADTVERYFAQVSVFSYLIFS